MRLQMARSECNYDSFAMVVLPQREKRQLNEDKDWHKIFREQERNCRLAHVRLLLCLLLYKTEHNAAYEFSLSIYYKNSHIRC